MVWPINLDGFNYKESEVAEIARIFEESVGGNPVGVQSLASGVGVWPMKLVVLGDSFDALGFASAGYETSFGWVPQLNLKAGKPFYLVNAGIDGNTTTMMRARFATDVLSQGKCWVKIPAGTVNDPANGILPETAIANGEAMCEQAEKAGLRVILATCPTNGLVKNTAYPERRRYYNAVNTWARNYAQAKGHLLADIDRYSTDPTTNDFLTGYALVDGVHFSTRGCQAVALGVFGDIGSQLPKRVVNGGLMDPYNLIGMIGTPVGDNAGALQTDSAALKAAAGGYVINPGTAGGVVSGNGPNGWAVRKGTQNGAASAVTSVVAAANGIGLAGRIVFTCGADAYNDVRFTIGADGLSATAGRWNIAWGAGQQITWNLRRRPIVANGYSYCPVAFTGAGAGKYGNTGGAEPAWIAEEGAFILDNEVLWMAQRIPLPGERLYAELRGTTSALTGRAAPEMRLAYTDTGSTTISTYDNFHTNDNTRGQYEASAHGDFVLRTREQLVMPALGPLQMYVEAKATGEAGSILTLDVNYAKIGNATREAALGMTV